MYRCEEDNYNNPLELNSFTGDSSSNWIVALHVCSLGRCSFSLSKMGWQGRWEFWKTLELRVWPPVSAFFELRIGFLWTWIFQHLNKALTWNDYISIVYSVVSRRMYGWGCSEDALRTKLKPMFRRKSLRLVYDDSLIKSILEYVFLRLTTSQNFWKRLDKMESCHRIICEPEALVSGFFTFCQQEGKQCP